ncbi:hypothetical protein KC220_28220, partial [Mycobacterium tuberculosis]|nr:hypothetical protein [Mycobacterium tuberculosis]
MRVQPVFRLELHLPAVDSGNLGPIVSAFKGQVLGFDRDANTKGWDVFRAMIPGSALDELGRV